MYLHKVAQRKVTTNQSTVSSPCTGDEEHKISMGSTEGLRAAVRFPAGTDFSLLYSVQS
jgi:hypothetical protein